jgi:hypothetical protein
MADENSMRDWVFPGVDPIIGRGMLLRDMAGGDPDRFQALLSERLKHDRAFARDFREWSRRAFAFYVNERIIDVRYGHVIGLDESE